jgi:UDP-N-acetyl-D-mannosaminuronic acid transferase (WecB/TagA/CpsF family)
VGISATTYDEAVRWIVASAKRGEPGIVTALPVHGVVTAHLDPSLREKINGFDIVTPDGQPVRWALNRLHGTGLTDRVYGPELMLRTCRAAARMESGSSFTEAICTSWRACGETSPPGFRP